MSEVRFSHVNIRVRDIVKSLDFYATLGLEVSGCLRLGAGMYAVYVSAPGVPDVTVELVVNENADDGYERSAGSGHLALAVGDLDAVLTRIEDAGIALETPPYHPADRDELLVAFVRDPDDVRVELLQGSFPTPQDALPEPIAAYRK